MKNHVLAVAAVAACLLAATACRHTTTVHGPGGESVSATAPSSVWIARGKSTPLVVSIDRQNFTGPVTVSIAQLPSGVSADRSSMTVETTQATFALKASKTADLVQNQAVMVTISDANGRRATQYVQLTVTDQG